MVARSGDEGRTPGIVVAGPGVVLGGGVDHPAGATSGDGRPDSAACGVPSAERTGEYPDPEDLGSDAPPAPTPPTPNAGLLGSTRPISRPTPRSARGGGGKVPPVGSVTRVDRAGETPEPSTGAPGARPAPTPPSPNAGSLGSTRPMTRPTPRSARRGRETSGDRGAIGVNAAEETRGAGSRSRGLRDDVSAGRARVAVVELAGVVGCSGRSGAVPGGSVPASATEPPRSAASTASGSAPGSP